MGSRSSMRVISSKAVEGHERATLPIQAARRLKNLVRGLGRVPSPLMGEACPEPVGGARMRVRLLPGVGGIPPLLPHREHNAVIRVCLIKKKDSATSACRHLRRRDVPCHRHALQPDAQAPR